MSHRYYIDYENTDPTKRFAIDPISGEVTTGSELDYETETEYTVHILAIDTGKLPVHVGVVG